MTPPRPPALLLQGATIGYGDRAVVHSVDLAIGHGEVAALLGANGSGKTTLVRGVLGLADLLGGRIEVLGQDVRASRDPSSVGYVPQRHTVVGALPSTVREVVATGRLARLGVLRRARGTDRDAVERAIAAVDLEQHAGADVAELSGGQQRRVLIARALAGEPRLLVMDEPTAGVDRASAAALVRTLATLVDRGVTLLVVTHEARTLDAILNRVVVLDEGHVDYDGPWPAAVATTAAGVMDDHHDGEEAGLATALGNPLGDR